MPIYLLFILVVASIGFLIATIFDGPARTVLMLAEALVVFFVGHRYIPRTQYLPFLLVPLVAPMILSLGSVESVLWQTGFFHEDAAVLILMAAGLVAVAVYLGKAPTPWWRNAGAHEDVEHTAWILAALYVLTFIWLSTHAFFSENVTLGTSTAVLIYMFIASVCYMVGRVTNARWKHVATATLVGLACALPISTDVTTAGAQTFFMLCIVTGAVITSVIWLERSAIRPLWRRWL